MTDLREKCARSVYMHRPACKSFSGDIIPWEEATEYLRWEAFGTADVILAIARPAIIEECARVAESYRRDNDLFMPTWKKIAAAIRALAEKP